MKLIIQIPCYNEAETLPATLEDLPRQVAGFDSVEILVVDDGSIDGTAEIAARYGADHILCLPANRGLANAYAMGLQKALELGADVIVNTDGDNQYQGDCVPDLVRPILDLHADMVIGDRQIKTLSHVSLTKKILQDIGSAVVRWASGTNVPDAASGFRALSRDAAMRLQIFSSYTYTLETIIQAGKKGLSVASVPIKVNPPRRKSRLIKSIPAYIARSAFTIIRIFLMYEALRVFLLLGALIMAGGLFLVIRFGYFYILGQGQGHVQSLIISAILFVIGFLIVLLGIIADLIAKNRRLIEEVAYKMRRAENNRDDS